MTERTFDGYRKQGLDADIERRILEHTQTYKIDPLDALKLAPVLMRRQWIKRYLAHTELFKLTLEIPGDIAELGVFRGNGLMTWANLLEAYSVGDRTKTVYGFDNWTGFSGFSPEDGKTVDDLQKVQGGFSPGAFREELKNAIDIFDQDRFVPWKPRIKLVEGHIEETVPAFANDNPGVRFSLIHFDCDLYRPTKAALESLWDRVTRGGVLIFDEYGIPDWPGETQAVDEFLAGQPGLRLQTFPWTNTPAAYLVKP